MLHFISASYLFVIKAICFTVAQKASICSFQNELCVKFSEGFSPLHVSVYLCFEIFIISVNEKRVECHKQRMEGICR